MGYISTRSSAPLFCAVGQKLGRRGERPPSTATTTSTAPCLLSAARRGGRGSCVPFPVAPDRAWACPSRGRRLGACPGGPDAVQLGERLQTLQAWPQAAAASPGWGSAEFGEAWGARSRLGSGAQVTGRGAGLPGDPVHTAMGSGRLWGWPRWAVPRGGRVCTQGQAGKRGTADPTVPRSCRNPRSRAAALPPPALA